MAKYNRFAGNSDNIGFMTGDDSNKLNSTWSIIDGYAAVFFVFGASAIAATKGVKVGSVLHEMTVGDLWHAHTYSTAIADGITVINASDLSVTWCRMVGSGPVTKYLSQNTWYVDPSAGSDWNDGYTGLTPLKTPAEIQRRWGGPRAKITCSPTISFMSSQPNGNVSLDIQREDPNNYLTLQPDASYNPTLVTAVLTSYTPVTVANKEVTVISATVNGSPINFSQYVGKRINFGANGYAWIVASNPGEFHMSRF